jgi:hypothetical protein
MGRMTISQFLSIRWSEPEGPLIEPPRFSPLIADPSFLFPSESPKGTWELFAHSAWGLHRFSSSDGLVWWDWGVLVRDAMRPFVRKIKDGQTGESDYALLFESYPRMALPLSALPWKRPWKSSIAVSWSDDLSTWTGRETLVEADLGWKRDPLLGSSVSNPCLIESGGEWLLYHSASLSWIEDCGFCEPRYIALSRGKSPAGPFIPEPLPIIDPGTDSLPGVLGAGSIKVLPMEDGFIGLQNKIYRDPQGKSRSAIFILRSPDGRAWETAREAPLIAPGTGWTRSHVYACDCRQDVASGRWHLYFNARDGWRTSEGRERIGRITGSLPD